MNLLRDYWSKIAPSGAYKHPRAGFQTVWVRDHLAQAQTRTEALRAQYIKPTDIF